MKDMEKEFIEFFEIQVEQKVTPSFPSKKKRFKWDNILLAASILGCLVLIAQPSIYDNRIRKSYVPMNKFEAFKENFPRVIYEGSFYFKEKQGVKND